MKDRFVIFCAVLLSCIPALLHAQQGEAEEVSTKTVSYIVIKGDKLKNVAVRFQVPMRTLKKLNNIKSTSFIVYPGLILHIPVKTRPKIWDPTKEDMSDNGLMTQDRRPSEDYEIITDSFDYDIRDDFMAVSEAVDDSLHFDKVAVHMGKIDKRVNVLNYRLDSLKQVEFSLDYQETDLSSVLGRMKMARDRYYTNGPIGREIDSLSKVKAKLGNLRVRLRNKITEYEYLRDNAEYAKVNYEKDENSKDTHWGDQITYESNYARSKAKHAELITEDAAAKARVDSMQAAAKAAKAAAALRDSLTAVAVAAMKDTLHPKPTTTVSPPGMDQPKPTPAVTQAIAPDPVPAPEPVTVAKETPPTTKPVAVVTKPVTPAPKPAPVVNNTPQPKQAPPATKPIAVAAPVTKPTAAPSKSSPFGLNQKVDIAPLIVKNGQIEITSHHNTELQLLPATTTAEIKPVSTDALAVPAAKDTMKSVSLPVKADTAVPAANTVALSDTVRKALAVPDTVQNPITVIVVKDSIKTVPQTAPVETKPTVATVVKDTVAKPVAHTTAIDTAHKAIPLIHIRDVTNKPVASTAVKPADAAHKPATTVTPKDTATKIAKTITPVKKPETSKPASVKNTTPPDTTVKETPDAKATREKKAREATEAAYRALKEAESKPDTTRITIAAKDTTPAAPVVSAPVIEKVEVPDMSRHPVEKVTEEGMPLSLDTKFDSAMLKKEVKINMDPLASYKTDSNFVISSVQLKEIPILEYKNKPKYLIPVDSLSQIKGEFYLIRARQVLEKGDFKEGDKFLRKSLELNPNNASTWMLHADLCLTTGAVDKALKEYLISGEIDSGNPKVFYNIALLFAKANDEQKAYKYFSKATDVNDKYLLAYMGRASVLMDQRDYEGAILDYDKTLSINKYYSPAYKGRALAKMEARHFDDAVTDFNQYLEIEDPDGYVLYQRGIAKILSNNLLQGCLDLSSSMELGFKDAEKAIKKFCE